jgi:3-oxoacyl-[acyl-carrier-protein] synthase-1
MTSTSTLDLPRPMPPLRLLAWTATTALGAGREALAAALHEGRSGLRPQDFCAGAPGHIGRVDGLEDAELPPALRRWDCRNNRLAWEALRHDGVLEAVAAACRRHGRGRVAVLMGTSTSSIGASEDAYAGLSPEGRFPPALARPEVHTPHSLGGFVAEASGAGGPCMTVATACSSSAQVFAQAQRMLAAGWVDAVLVGGVDSLCRSVLHGFAALGLVSPERCRPFDAARQGVSLAEAGGFALLERAEGVAADDELRLVGHGASSDAHHMSAPHPEGAGAAIAMRQALARAGVHAAQVDYLNLHGTATPKNDEVEAAVVGDLGAPSTRASSTKALTGHALGAAGIVEAVISCLALRDGVVPGNAAADVPARIDDMLDARFAPMLVHAPTRRPMWVAMSNSFGFGGNNACLVFRRGAA